MTVRATSLVNPAPVGATVIVETAAVLVVPDTVSGLADNEKSPPVAGVSVTCTTLLVLIAVPAVALI